MILTPANHCKKCGAINGSASKHQWHVMSGIKYCGHCGRRQGR